MPKFKVHLQQYVEEVATIEVEADSIEEARAKALLEGPMASWEDGEDSYSVSAYAVHDDKGELVWER